MFKKVDKKCCSKELFTILNLGGKICEKQHYSLRCNTFTFGNFAWKLLSLALAHLQISCTSRMLHKANELAASNVLCSPSHLLSSWKKNPFCNIFFSAYVEVSIFFNRMFLLFLSYFLNVIILYFIILFSLFAHYFK